MKTLHDKMKDTTSNADVDAIAAVVPKCAQCKKAYKQSEIGVGCPKCAPGVKIDEIEFQKPISEATVMLPSQGARDEREAFESWAKEYGFQRDELDRCTIGIVSPEYFDRNTETTWQSWKARAALAAAPAAPVELPKPDMWRDEKGLRGYTADPGNGPWYTAETVRALLAAAQRGEV